MDTDKIIYYEPAGRPHSLQHNLLDNPPSGYHFVTGKSVIDNTLVANNFIFYKLRRTIMERVLPVTLTKARLDSYIKKIPNDVNLIYSSNHVIFRKIPWVVNVEWAHLLIGRDIKQFPKHKHIIERLLSSEYCKGIFTWTEMAKQSILLNYDCSSFAHKIQVIPHVAMSKHFTKDYKDDRIRLLFVGTVNSLTDFNIKGGYEVLEVFNILSRKYSNLELVIRAKVPDYVKSAYSNNPYIRIIDEIIPWTLLEQEFKQADIFLFPSHLLQNTVVLEAMSYELPVITTFIGSSGGEFVEDGVTGFVVPSPEGLPYFTDNYFLTSETINREVLARSEKTIDPKVVNALVEKTSLLIENSALRIKMGKAARKEIDEGKFSIEKRNRKLKTVFDYALI